MRAPAPDMRELARCVRALMGLDAQQEGSRLLRLRAVSWNLHLGGVDGVLERRLRTQAQVLAALQPDVLALQECTFWDEHEHRRLLWMAHELGMVPARMERSRIGDGRNHTALLYRPTTLRLVGQRALGVGVFHHALIRARLRPLQAEDASDDLLVFATHFTYSDGDSRLREARWLTGCAGEGAGLPERAVLLGDLNCSGLLDTDPEDWGGVARALHARYRLVDEEGRFGAMDRRALQVLLHSGWTDPQSLIGEWRAPTVGHGGVDEGEEPVPLRLDHILVRGLPVTAYRTHDTPLARQASDHLPVVLDTHLRAPRPQDPGSGPDRPGGSRGSVREAALPPPRTPTPPGGRSTRPGSRPSPR